jgi:hypothetical protein
MPPSAQELTSEKQETPSRLTQFSKAFTEMNETRPIGIDASITQRLQQIRVEPNPPSPEYAENVIVIADPE